MFATRFRGLNKCNVSVLAFAGDAADVDWKRRV